MTTTYRTIATRLTATPLGLLPERWTIEHWCDTCRDTVPTDELLTHAQNHEHHHATAGASRGTRAAAVATIHPEGDTIE